MREGSGRHRFRAKRVKAEKVRVAKSQGGKRAPQVFVLRTYIVRGMGVKKLHIDRQVNVVPAFLGGCDYLNVGMCGSLLARILILLQTPLVHLAVKQIRDRKQLIKVGALSKVVYGLSL